MHHTRIPTRPLAVLALLTSTAFAPTLATAEGCHSDEKATMSCAEGSEWNAETATCVPKPSS